MKQTIEVYKCLANESRLSIVQELARQNEAVSSGEILGSCSLALNLAQPTLSQHFSRLVRAGVLTEAKQGVEKYYQLDRRVLERAGIDIEKLIRNGGESGA